jgi:hypothetical protein
MLVMEIGVGLAFRVPGDFRGEDRLTVDDGREFIVTCAEIESDPATVQVCAEGDRGFLLSWDLVWTDGFDEERSFVDCFHELDVEVTGAAVAVGVDDGRGDLRWAADDESPSAHLPEEEFDEALDVEPGGGVVIRMGRQDFGAMDGDAAVVAFEGDEEGLAPGVIGDEV